MCSVVIRAMKIMDLGKNMEYWKGQFQRGSLQWSDIWREEKGVEPWHWDEASRMQTKWYIQRPKGSMLGSLRKSQEIIVPAAQGAMIVTKDERAQVTEGHIGRAF